MSHATRILFVAWLSVLTLAVAGILWKSWEPHFDEITVGRIDVVEPDGQPRLILSSRARFPGILFGGKEYRHATRDTGGMLFFNSEGDEMGGLTFDGLSSMTRARS